MLGYVSVKDFFSWCIVVGGQGISLFSFEQVGFSMIMQFVLFSQFCFGWFAEYVFFLLHTIWLFRMAKFCNVGQ